MNVLPPPSLLFILVLLSSETIASRSRTPINLYERETVVQPLDSSDFDRVVYNSSLATLVEYYAHWCGACKKVKPKIIELARQSVRWHESIIRVAAVNCGDAAFNEDLCQRHEIEIYPSLRLFAPKLAANRHGLTMQVDSVQVMLHRMVDFVQEKFHIPHLRDFESKKIESIFGSNKNAKYAILVVENKDSYLGKKLILDFLSKHHQVVIRRMTPESNPKLASQLSASDSSTLPKVFVLSRVKTQPEAFDLPFLKQLKPDLDTNDLERNVGEDARSKLDWMIDRLIETTSTSTGEDETVEKVENQDQEDIEESSSTEANDSENDSNLENILDKVYMQDLESGLHLIIRSDISHSRIITGHKFDALKEWLRILVKYFPGRDVVRNYLINLSERLNQMSEITGNDWKTIADERTDDAYLPNVVEWYHCRGSNPEFRGYPCSLWTLFHVLTVAQIEQEYNKSNPFDDFKIKEVIEGIQLFVKYFFTCKECSENFARETHDYASNLEKPNDAVIYLWKVHNKVNRRLANEKDNDQDPKFPKVLFPTKTQCPKCRVESPETSNDDNANKATWNLREVQNYLNKYYSRSNLVPIEKNPTVETSIEEVEKVAENEEQATTTNKIISVLDNVFSMRNGGVKVQVYTFLDKLVVFFTTFCYFSIY